MTRPLNDPTPNAAFRTPSKPVSPPEFWLSTVLCLGPVSTGKAECGVSQGLATERRGGNEGPACNSCNPMALTTWSWVPIIQEEC